MGPGFQAKLDEHSKELGPRHRSIDHTFPRLNYLSRIYGPVGYAEVLLHWGADYGLVDAVSPDVGKPKSSLS